MIGQPRIDSRVPGDNGAFSGAVGGWRELGGAGVKLALL